MSASTSHQPRNSTLSTARTACAALRLGRNPYDWFWKFASKTGSITIRHACWTIRGSHGRKPQGPFTAIRLGNVCPQHRLGLVPSCLQIRRYFLEKRCHALSLHLFQAHAIDAGTASVGFHFLPSPPQYIGPQYAVIECVEPSLPTLLGRQV